MMLDDQILQRAMALGAKRASALDVAAIPLDRMFRDVCATNTCGRYGRCYMCPPDVGDIEDLMAKVRAYRRAVLFQTVRPLEDSFDIEGMQDAAKAHGALCRALRVACEGMMPEPFLVLGSGGCGRCDTCAKVEHLPCRFPGDALSSLEGYGVNVYQAACNAGLPYINGQNTVTYFGLVLYGQAPGADSEAPETVAEAQGADSDAQGAVAEAPNAARTSPCQF
ncbi:MAG: DUF2284 domain-containing protein [Clostridia bacterium]